VIAPERAGDSAFGEHFRREYRTDASTDHPHVVTRYEAGETDDLLFIAMRLVRGDDLRQLVPRGGGLDPEQAAVLVAQVGATLDAAPPAGLVHRDVNVLGTGPPAKYRTLLTLTHRGRGVDPLALMPATPRQ
jgi:serine/threonine protein kinase